MAFPFERDAVVLVWRQPAPGDFARLLRALGARAVGQPADDETWLALEGGLLIVRRARGARDVGLSIADAEEGGRAALVRSGRSDASAAARLRGIGFGAVDVERIAEELGVTDGEPVVEPELGGRGLLSTVPRPEPRIVCLEPTTEGRLAAALARFGEGPLALYVAPAAGLATDVERLPAELASPQETALGVPGRLVRPDRPWGPFLFVLTG